MQITRSSIDTAKGPDDWFTGDVYIDSVAAAPPPSRLTANLVHFMPGARTHWHRHPLSQTHAFGDEHGLAQGVAVPVGAGTGHEVHQVRRQPGRRRGRGDGVDVDVAGEPVVRSLAASIQRRVICMGASF